MRNSAAHSRLRTLRKKENKGRNKVRAEEASASEEEEEKEEEETEELKEEYTHKWWKGG